MFFNKKSNSDNKGFTDFSYIDPNSHYFDSACQTLRPQQVIDAETEYYHKYNACGHRVKYKWGEIVDEKIEETRKLLIELAGKSPKEYTVAFSLNTTFGINTLVHQLDSTKYDSIVTSEIEHNSVFLPTISWAKKNNKTRKLLKKLDDGGLDYEKGDLERAVVVVNGMSNFDGRKLTNAKLLADDVHNVGGRLIIDGAQIFGHDTNLLKDVDFDAVCGSAHKMYSASLGFIIIKKEFVKELDCYLIGGSTVDDVYENSYDLVSSDDEVFARIEPGLQNYAGIISLGEAIKWRKNFNSFEKNALESENALAIRLNEGLKSIPGVKMLNDQPSSVVSIYSDKMDGHKMGMYLGARNIMCRTGYFCCHYYLKNLKKYPPMLRISLGLNNTDKQVDLLIDSLKKILI